MFRPASLLLAALLVAAPLIAGCTSGPGDSSSAPSTMTTSGNRALGPESIPWVLGEWWDQNFFVGSDDAVGLPLKVIVTDGSNKTGFRLATDNNQTAAIDAAFFFQTLGTYDTVATDAKGRVMGIRAGDYQWPWYRFPLVDGDSWTATMRNVDDEGQTFTLDLTANVTARAGGRFTTDLRSPDGGLVATYDYDPTTHWFTTALFYDYRAPVAVPEAPRFRIVNAGHGTGWNGTWYEAAATLLVSKSAEVVPPNATTPEPTYSFTMTADQDHLLAFPFAFAAGGAWNTQIIAPDGRHYETPAYAAPGGAGAGASLYVPGAVGEWRVISQGAGAFAAGGGLLAFGIKETAHVGLGA